MAKYDYIKLRVNAEERSRLESMVAAGEVTSLSDAVRKLAFDQNGEVREVLTRYLQEVADAHQALAELVRAGLQQDKLTEADVFAMEREVRSLVSSASDLSREIRRVM